MKELTYNIYNQDCVEAMKLLDSDSVDSIVSDPPYGIDFMNKGWDHQVPGKEVWEEALRVLKPGGHLIAFAGSRTYHRMAVNVEDAGFEIRDQLFWMYGSGFPKSHNIGKAVDKKLGNEREVVGENPNHRKSDALYELGFQGGKGNGQVTKGTSEWEGWGTALKPAHEPMVLARKPLSEKSIVNNVLKHGTGGINIDDCRVPTDNNNNEGRFPANILHDGSDEVKSVFPNAKGGNFPAQRGAGVNTGFGAGQPTEGGARSLSDEGNASRYFYCAKVNKKERNRGMDHLPDKVLSQSGGAQAAGDSEYTAAQSIGLNRQTIAKNNHPTVKPIALMRYLTRLVTPPGGTVLDPFSGSGSTGVACMLEGFNYIGCELDADYVVISEARIEHAKDNPEEWK